MTVTGERHDSRAAVKEHRAQMRISRSRERRDRGHVNARIAAM
jgi:hypothetical protein